MVKFTSDPWIVQASAQDSPRGPSHCSSSSCCSLCCSSNCCRALLSQASSLAFDGANDIPQKWPWKSQARGYKLWLGSSQAGWYPECVRVPKTQNETRYLSNSICAACVQRYPGWKFNVWCGWNTETNLHVEDDGFSRDPRCFGCFTKHIQTNTRSHHYPELTAGAVSTWVWLVCCCFSDSQTINGLARSWNGHETNDKYIVIISHI